MPLVRVGWAVGPHGVKGALKFAYTTDHPEWIAKRATYILSDPRTKEALELTPLEIKTRGTDFTIRFAGYDAPEELEPLRGWNLGYVAKRGALPRENPDDVYLFELPGMQLRRPDGSVIGTVINVRESSAHTLLELDLPGEPLVPFIREHVPEVHLADGYMVCTYPLE
ncbi:MAG: ribosome maturation factor RimM [bacterium]|nr:ribosome maturation factor RimM [bacterium]